jgi:hypothetical protein
MASNEQLLDMIQELVDQACADIVFGKPLDTYSSGFITVYAEAMRMLADHGRFYIENDDGGRYVSGRFIVKS